VSEAIVVPISPVPQRGLCQWCDGAALTVGNLVVNGIRYFLKVMKFLDSKRVTSQIMGQNPNGFEDCPQLPS